MIRFLIDGTDYGAPLNWEDVKVKYKRDDVVRGLFTTYTSEMEFSGRAYQYLVGLWDSRVCNTADILIQRRSGIFGAWTTVIEGVITLDNNTKVFRNKPCKIVVSAEQSGCNGVFFKNIDTEVDIGSAGDAVAGTLWVEIGDTYRQWWKYTDAVLDGGPGYFAQPPVSGCYGKNALLIFNQISDYITGLAGFTAGCLPVVSNFLDSPRVDQIFELEITTLPANGEFITVEWDDCFGNHHTATVEKRAGDTLPSIASKLYYAMIWQDNSGFGAILQPKWRKGEVGTAVHTSGTTEIIEMTFHVEVSNMTVNAASGTASVTETVPYGDGARDCVFVPSEFDDQTKWTGLSSGGFNYGQLYPGVLKMSFKKFFEVCSKMWNLGMQIEPDGGGGFQIRIEPIAYFYDNPVALTLRELDNVEHSADNDLFAKKWWTGKEDDNVNTAINDGNPEPTTFPGSAYFETANTEWWIYADPNCDPEYDIRFSKEIVPALGLTFHEDILRGNVQNPGYLYMIDVKGWSPGPQVLAAQAYEWMVGAYVLVPPNPPFFSFFSYYHTNIREQPQHIYLNNRSIMPEHDAWTADYEYKWDATSGGAVNSPDVSVVQNSVTIPEGAYWLPYRWRFKTNISYTQWAAISAAQKIGVNEGNDPGDDVEGWIREVEYRLYDGATTFIIEAKS